LIKDIKKAEPKYKVNKLCRVFGLSLNSYYYKPATASLEDIKLMALIKDISVDSGNTYGRRRIHVELAELGHDIGIYKTVNLMEKLNIKAIRPKKCHYYPLSGKQHKYAPNLLKRQFDPASTNTVGSGVVISNK
jgi:hypothetical protein